MYKQLNQATHRPVVWSSYTAETLWTEPHIAKQMLSYHLNPEINAASRSFDFIDASVSWFIAEFGLNQYSKTIDFGCGPGLYTHRLKQRGIGTVVGLDFSSNSLEYATKKAQVEGLSIKYKLGNYLNYSDSTQYDLITLVMCDFCALSPTQRSQLLAKFKSLLAPQGVIALDVFTATRFAKLTETVELAHNHMNGFWSEKDYWCIHTSFAYQKESVWLDKFVICEEDKQHVVYNWLQHFTLDMLNAELEQHGLKITNVYRDLCGNPWQESDEMAVTIMHG